MVHSHGNAALSAHRLQDFTVRHIHDKDAFHVESALHEFGSPVIDFVHGGAHQQVWAVILVHFGVNF
jgi:hypothetical protein